MSKLTVSQTKILTDYYLNWYGILEVLGDVYDVLKRDGS